MLYTTILFAHIFAALISFALIGFAVLCILRPLGGSKIVAIVLACVALFEVASGFLLATLSPTLTALDIAPHLVIYLSVCLVVEIALTLRMQKVWIG